MFRRKVGTGSYNEDPRGELEGNITLDEMSMKWVKFRMDNLETAYIKQLEEVRDRLTRLEKQVSTLRATLSVRDSSLTNLGVEKHG